MAGLLKIYNHVIETSTGTLPTSWQNAVLHEDVNADGLVAPLDALLLINELRRPRIAASPGGLLPPITATVKPSPYLDVDGDGYLAPVDVLNVVNRLSRRSNSGEGEGQPSDPTRLDSIDAYWRDYGAA